MAVAYTPLGRRNIVTPEERINASIAAQNALAANNAAQWNAGQQSSATAQDIMRQDAFNQWMAAQTMGTAQAQAQAQAARDMMQARMQEAQAERDFRRQMQEAGWGREDVVEAKKKAERESALAALGLGGGAATPGGAVGIGAMGPEMMQAASILGAAGADIGDIGSMMARQSISRAEEQKGRDTATIEAAMNALAERGDAFGVVRQQEALADGVVTPDELKSAQNAIRQSAAPKDVEQIAKLSLEAKDALGSIKYDMSISGDIFGPSLTKSLPEFADKIERNIAIVLRESVLNGMDPRLAARQILEMLSNSMPNVGWSKALMKTLKDRTESLLRNQTFITKGR